MNADDRLARALQAPTAPQRDYAFTLAVMEAAERQRYRNASIITVARTVGTATAVCALAIPALAWRPENLAALQDGAVLAGAMLALVSFARIMSQRLTLGVR